jgi:RNA polymerase sigma-70 factor (ECF subfamily)
VTIASLAGGPHPVRPASDQADSAADRHARFERLCAAFRSDLFRFVLWLTRDQAVAEDVVQETLFRAWRFLDSLDEDRAARAWLLAIARREAARLFERPRPETIDVDAVCSADEMALACPSSAEIDAVHQAIWSLPTDYGEPLALHALFGYSAQEIGAHLGLTPGAVLTRLHRARGKLRLMLTESPAEAGRRQSRSDLTNKASQAA